MAVADAHVHVWCDSPDCDYQEEIGLTALAGNRCWDERNVDPDLGRYGWTIARSGDDILYICPNCTEDAKEEGEEL